MTQHGARETTYYTTSPYAKAPFHVFAGMFAGMSRTFCGRVCDDWYELPRRGKRSIISDPLCCECCKKALINRDGASS
jgi:hypothetical protein